MKQIGVLFIMSFCFLITPGYCFDKNRDWKAVSDECLNAYNSFESAMVPRFFGTEKTVEYEGMSGDQNGFTCSRPVVMSLVFTKDRVAGQYYFENQPAKIVKVKGRLDVKGQLVLVEEPDTEDVAAYTFKGVARGRTIKGVWSKGDEKKQFAFMAEETGSERLNRSSSRHHHRPDRMPAPMTASPGR